MGFSLALATMVVGCSKCDETTTTTPSRVVLGDVTDLRTSETGSTATFTIALEKKPTSNVVVPLSSSDTTEGTVAPSSLTFTPENWNAPQQVVVTGVDDTLEDGAITYQAVIGTLQSDDVYFSRYNPDDVDVSNIDNDTAGVTVAPRQGLTTTESGGTAEFAVVLNAQPTAAVTIEVTSGDPTEGTASPSTLTFTTTNWNSPQTVRVTGADDGEADGPKDYQIVVGPVTSSDADYAAVNPDDVSVTNTDNDSPGVTVTVTDATSGENGSTGAVTVVLNSQPTSDVTIAVASSDTSEATAAPGTLTFTTSNWNAPQTVLLAGVDDSVADGNQPYQLQFTSVTSSDAGYSGLSVASVSLSNVDDDSPGVTVDIVDGTSGENGSQADVTYVLNSQPTSDVTITVTSSTASEGVAAPASLTFTTSNWNAPQHVLVTGQNDDVADGDQVYQLDLVVSSSDAGYDGLVVAPTPLTNVDDDSAGVTVDVVDGSTDEGGSQGEVTYVLNSQPTADVVLTIASSDPGEGTGSPTTLTFTATDWMSPQSVFVTGVNDDIADGDQPYQLTVTVASSDAGYDGLLVAAADLTNVDDDSAGITVTVNDAVTSEAGDEASVSFSLNSEPTSDVTFTFTTSNGEGTPVSSTITFTTMNWASPQELRVHGQDDAVADGNQPYQLLVLVSSSDASYAGRAVAPIDLTNVDNDSAGIVVSAVDVTSSEQGAGQADVTYVLTSQPTADVVLAVVSSDTTEGTVSTSTLTFTSANWNAPQHVLVTGQDDAVADGDFPYQLQVTGVTSSDANYDGLVVAPVDFTNVDDDTAGITRVVVDSNSGEAGAGTADVSYVLNSEPTADVTLTVASSDATEGVPSVTTLTFTSSNWNAPQHVLVTGQDDALADGNVAYTLDVTSVASADLGYNGQGVAQANLANVDDDSAGITVGAISGNTTEAGGTATFTIVLNSQPFGDVTVNFASNYPSEGTTNGNSRTFTAANWNVPQTVTVTGLDDNSFDGNQNYSIVFSATTSTDGAYAAITPASVSLVNIDNDSAGILVSAISRHTNEAGQTATFTVVLNSQPYANVTVNFTSTDTTEGTLSVNQLVFTQANWNVPQTVTVTGVDDLQADGNQPYAIFFGATTSTDPSYAAIIPGNVNVINDDNDSPGLVANPSSGTTTEAGGTFTFTVRLATQPFANVTVTVTSNDTTEGTVSAGPFTFTTADWNVPRTVVVTGVDDAVTDGNIAYAIVLSTSGSADAAYAALSNTNVSVSNTDNDPIARSVNGLTWYVHPTSCGVPCNATCAAYGLVPADDATTFAAQDTAAECMAIATAWGLATIQLSGFTYACLEDDAGNHTPGPQLVGSLYCSTYSGCPAQHRTSMDQNGLACGSFSRKSICACQ
ncbi:MAG: hypothetical protein U0230_00220 [Polyangiales bacterium]